MSQDALTTVRYSKVDLAEFMAIIEKKIKAAKADLNFYMDSLRAMADNSDTKFKELDDGTASAEVTRLNTLASRQEKHIARLGNAAQRIENKTYGVCRETGTLIPKNRLKAVPHATLSVEAKMAR